MSVEVIKPREITGKILSLIEETLDEVTLITPYLDVANWTKVKQALKRAKNRGVRIIVYLREDQASTAWMVEPYADSVYLVERLHAKLYLNSTSAVFTSMNLVQTSDEKSTDLGIYSTDNTTLTSFRDFINTYLRPNTSKHTQHNGSDHVLYERSSYIATQPPESRILKEFLLKLKSALKKESPDSNRTKASTYLFSANAAPNGDVMISGDRFVWKLYKDSNDAEKYAKWFTTSVNAKFSDEIKIELDREHKKFIYVTAQVLSPPNDVDLQVKLFKHILNK